MIFKYSGKAVSPKEGNIRNTKKPIQNFTVTKITNNSKKINLEACLVIVLRHFVLAVLSDLKINIYEVEFPHPCSHTTSK